MQEDMTPDMRDEIIVTLHDFPTSVNGVVSVDADGTFCIHLNARHSQDAQRRAFEHEMKHLRNNDLHNHRHIEDIEDQAD